MFSRAASLRRLAATASSSLLRPAAAASVLRFSPLSTTAKRASKKAAVPAPEAASTTAPKKAAVKRAPRKAAVPSPEAVPAPEVASTTAPKKAAVKRAPRKAAVPATEVASTTAPNKAAVKRAPRKAAVPSPEAVAAAAPPQQSASDLPLPPPAKVKRAPKKAAVPAPEAASTTAPKKAAVKRAPRKAAVPSPEAVVAAAPPQQAASDLPPPAKVKRPTEIPFQPQVANTVHLVGTVGVQPVLEKNSSGECKAVTVIVEKNDSLEDDSSQLWIPVIFQGDLAEIAADHLKENDLIYIVGQLSGDEPTTTVEDAHNKIRVFARSLSFVESNSQDKKRAFDRSGNVKDESRWTDVFANPGDWEDNRINKQNGTVGPRYPDFTHKSSGQALWLSSSPGWVQLKLDDLKTFGTSDLTYDSTSKKTLLPNKKKNEDLWKDVIENPTKWWDQRLNKRNPKAPDFKHKDSDDALWLNTSPSWVREKLPPAESATNTDSWATATVF